MPDRSTNEPVGDAPRDLSHLAPEHREVVQRLYARVEQAVETIEQLRAANRRLRERVAELESRPAVPDDKTMVMLDDDPEALRDRIAGFIATIDRYLDDASETEASDGAPDEEGVDEPSGLNGVRTDDVHE